jgi:hypothetical protein
MFLVGLPATDCTRHHNQQNQNGNKGKLGTLRPPIRMKRVLMGNYLIIWRRLLGCFQISGDRFVFVDSHTLGISADIGFVEDASGEQIKLFFFESQKQTASYLRRGDNLFQRDAPRLSLLTQMFAE